MSWYIRNYPHVGFDGTRTSDGAYFLEPQAIVASSQELPQGFEHYLFWNTTEAAVGERVLRTGDAMRLLDVMEAIVIRETWPKTAGNGYTGIYLWQRAGLSQTGTFAAEASGSYVDQNGPNIGVTDIAGYYLPNAMTLVTAQPAVPPSQENRTSILTFLQKCRASMLRNAALWAN